MDTANLKAFIQVAESESFSLAAEQLFLTQPAVSKRIKQLEQQFGSQLIDRIGKRVKLTRTGELLLPRARKILHDLQAARQQIADFEGNPSGALSIATSHHIGLHRLPPVLRAYVSSYPEVELDLSFMDSEEACQLVEHNEIELAIVTLPFKTVKGLNYQRVWRDDLRVVCANDHPLTGIAHPTLTDLLPHTAILPSHGTFTREAIEKALSAYRDQLQISLETNYLETIKMMVSVGLGWSILPHSMVDASLSEIRLADFACGRDLGIVINPQRSRSRAVEAMLATLAATASTTT